MMAQARRYSKRWIWWVVILVILVVVGVVVYLIWNNNFRNKEEKTGESTTGQVEEKKENKTEQKTEDISEPEDEKKVKQYEGKDPNESEVLTGAVTYAGVAGDNLIIRVNIDQYLYEGKCVLSLIRNGGVVYSATAAIATSASTATCEGFNVPMSELGSGEMDVKVELSSGGKVGVINGKAEI